MQTHAIKSNASNTEEMLSWVRIIRFFKIRDQKSEHAKCVCGLESDFFQIFELICFDRSVLK